MAVVDALVAQLVEVEVHVARNCLCQGCIRSGMVEWAHKMLHTVVVVMVVHWAVLNIDCSMAPMLQAARKNRLVLENAVAEKQVGNQDVGL